MAIFNSYVSLPEGSSKSSFFGHPPMIISSMFLDVFLRIAKDELLVIWWDLVVWIPVFFLNPRIPPKSPVHHISWPVIVLLVEWVECTVSIASTPTGREPRGGGLRLARIRHTDLFHHLASLSTALADERWALLSLSCYPLVFDEPITPSWVVK